MLKDYVLFNLTEAKDAIEKLVAEMEADPEYDVGNFAVDMQHIYWHVNSAWNGKDFDVTGQELTKELYESFIQFPADLPL